LIERAGEVIPKVIKVIISKRKTKRKKIEVPSRCPVCGQKVSKEKEEEVYWYCINPDCPARLQASLLHFASRSAMDIEGMGESLVQDLLKRNMVKSIVDIYKLTEADLLKLPLFKEKKAKKTVSAIIRSKQRGLNYFLYALGIRHIGEKGARLLAEKFPDIDLFFNLDKDQIQNIPEIGEVMAESLVDFFSQPKIKRMIKEFKVLRVNLKNIAKHKKASSLKGKTFVFTGELDSFSRNEAKSLVEELGAATMVTVSKKTDFVVVGKNPGFKHKKAIQLSVKTIDEREFKRIIAGK
jgi:DNA ligase (NAD+)